MSKKHIGSSFDAFLAEDGLLNEASAVAVKRVLAWQIAEAMKAQKLSKAKMAALMKTSRPALERLLDPSNASVTLQTMSRAAAAVGKRLRIQLEDAA